MVVTSEVSHGLRGEPSKPAVATRGAAKAVEPRASRGKEIVSLLNQFGEPFESGRKSRRSCSHRVLRLFAVLESTRSLICFARRSSSVRSVLDHALKRIARGARDCHSGGPPRGGAPLRGTSSRPISALAPMRFSSFVVTQRASIVTGCFAIPTVPGSLWKRACGYCCDWGPADHLPHALASGRGG